MYTNVAHFITLQSVTEEVYYTDYATGVDYPQKRKLFYSKTSKPTPRPTRSPFQWVLGALSHHAKHELECRG